MIITGSGSESGSLVIGMDPRFGIRIRIHSKMSWIRNTGLLISLVFSKILFLGFMSTFTNFDTKLLPKNLNCLLSFVLGLKFLQQFIGSSFFIYKKNEINAL
jgi:hypothetical protein